MCAAAVPARAKARCLISPTPSSGSMLSRSPAARPPDSPPAAGCTPGSPSMGATTANLKGGLGSASATTSGGVKVAAIAAVNAVGSVTVGDGPWFWAAPFEIGNEYGGRGLPASFTPDILKLRAKGGAAANASENTTIAVLVTDAALTKPQAKRLAMIAQTGFARAIYPVHAPTDGDVVFAAATGEKPIDPLAGLTELGMVAANVMARAIARGVHEATALPFAGALPSWKE